VNDRSVKQKKMQVLLHFIGDYILQNHWMSVNKKKKGFIGFLACLIHCLTYSLPFLFIGSIPAVFVIFVSHFIIDRWNIVPWFIAVKNGTFHIKNCGFPADTPSWLSVWLMIIIDNIIHVSCNMAALEFL
jgi:hypothetical protein